MGLRQQVGTISEERELTILEMIERTGHDRSFFKKARKQGLPFQTYGKSVRILWSEWTKWREQHRQVG